MLLNMLETQGRLSPSEAAAGGALLAHVVMPHPEVSPALRTLETIAQLAVAVSKVGAVRGEHRDYVVVYNVRKSSIIVHAGLWDYNSNLLRDPFPAGGRDAARGAERRLNDHGWQA